MLGREREEAEDAVRFTSLEPSKPPLLVEVPLKGGAMSFRAIGFGGLDWLRLVVELALLLGILFPTPLKSTVCARAVPLAGGGSGLPIRRTSTQSGSGDGVKGLPGRLGLGM